MICASQRANSINKYITAVLNCFLVSSAFLVHSKHSLHWNQLNRIAFKSSRQLNSIIIIIIRITESADRYCCCCCCCRHILLCAPFDLCFETANKHIYIESHLMKRCFFNLLNQNGGRKIKTRAEHVNLLIQLREDTHFANIHSYYNWMFSNWSKFKTIDWKVFGQK